MTLKTASNKFFSSKIVTFFAAKSLLRRKRLVYLPKAYR